MNVYEAALRRLDEVFKNFKNVYVSFSGGKDSGVLFQLCLQWMDKHPEWEGKLGVFHIDYEAQYQLTTDYVDRVFSIEDQRLEFYRICLPLMVPTSTSVSQTYWQPWHPTQQGIWVRPLPDGGITQIECFKEGMSDYDFNVEFAQWYKKEHGDEPTCCLVGIRTQESLNRWRTIHAESDGRKNWGDREWTTLLDEGLVNAYPIFDWLTEDIWIANAKFGWDYNRLYDLFYQAGLGIDQMRVASPFIGQGQEHLKLYRVIEPNTWAKLLGRVDGVNFTGIYGGTTAMGWKSITLPEGHTWESYMYFLLSTLPEDTRKGYLDKLSTSVKFWRERGGVLSEEVIEKLKAAGVSIEVGDTTNYKTTKKPVRMDYLDDVDIAEFKEIPTYKRMCICIMKNDFLCKYMGFSQTKRELLKRKEIMDKYNSLL